MAVAAIGETPMSPVMTENGTVVMPVLQRIANPSAAPRTGAATLLAPKAGSAPSAIRPSICTAIHSREFLFLFFRISKLSAFLFLASFVNGCSVISR